MNPLLVAALGYAEHARRVVPLHTPDSERRCSCAKGAKCPTPGKHPRLQKDWVGRATTDANQIIQWWEMWPNANVGVVCGHGLLVLDVDETGWQMLADLQQRHGQLPRTAVVRTGSDGGHFYFQAPEDARSFSFEQGLSVQAAGKLVVAPPSLHASGRHYGWVRNGELAPAPAWLLRKPSVRSSATSGEKIVAGARHAHLLALAGAMRRQGADRPTIEAALLRFNEDHCDPPKDEAVVLELAADVTGRYEPAPETEREDKDYPIYFDDKNKLQVHPHPSGNEEICQWLTGVLRSRQHPIFAGQHFGSGGRGKVELLRVGAEPMKFEPASLLNTSKHLIATLVWQADEPPYGLRDEHAREIAFTVRLLCGPHRELTDTEETFGIIHTYVAEAIAIEGHTLHGTVPQRYEALKATRRDLDGTTGRPIGPPRYLVDAQTDDLVVPVAELQTVARRFIGSSIAHGWLDARMEGIGWARISLSAHAEPGRAGRHSDHVHFDAYRGDSLGHGGTDDDPR